MKIYASDWIVFYITYVVILEACNDSHLITVHFESHEWACNPFTTY